MTTKAGTATGSSTEISYSGPSRNVLTSSEQPFALPPVFGGTSRSKDGRVFLIPCSLEGGSLWDFFIWQDFAPHCYRCRELLAGA